MRFKRSGTSALFENRYNVSVVLWDVMTGGTMADRETKTREFYQSACSEPQVCPFEHLKNICYRQNFSCTSVDPL